MACDLHPFFSSSHQRVRPSAPPLWTRLWASRRNKTQNDRPWWIWVRIPCSPWIFSSQINQTKSTSKKTWFSSQFSIGRNPDMPALCRLAVSIMVVVVNKGFLRWRLCTGHVVAICYWREGSCSFESCWLLKFTTPSKPGISKKKTVLKWAITVMSFVLEWKYWITISFMHCLFLSEKKQGRKVKNKNSQNLRVFVWRMYIDIYIYIYIYA